jgi:hypothetical protein
MRATLFAVAVLILSTHAAFTAPMLPSDIQATFLNGQPFTASTQSGTKFKMNFMSDGGSTSAIGPKRTYQSAIPAAAFGGKADTVAVGGRGNF